MDASASSRADIVNKDVYGFILKIENTEFPAPIKQKSTTIKFTKLPEFDFDSKGSWHHQSSPFQPRLRRLITLEDPKSISNRSLTAEHLIQSKPMTAISKRKIVTISEDDEYDLHPRFSKDTKKSSSVKTTSRSVCADFKEPKQSSQRATSRLSYSSKYSKETKPSAKLSNDGKEPKPKTNYRSKPSNISHISTENTRSRNVKVKDTIKSTKSLNSSKTSVSKNYITPSESENELSLIKSKLYENLKSSTPKKPVENVRVNKSSIPQQAKSNTSYFKELQGKHKPAQVIHVPLEVKYRKSAVATPAPISSTHSSQIELVESGSTNVAATVTHKDMNVCTDPLPEKVDSVTEMDKFEPQMICKCIQSTDVQTELFKETYDSLEIPNVTLTKSDSKERSQSLHSNSLPNLQIPPFKVMLEDENADTSYHKSTSYIISRATLTYTTKQKFNLHVVGSSDDAYSNQSPSPLSYPINVVSVYKKEMQSLDSSNDAVTSNTDRDKTSKQCKNRINDIKSLDCSYVANSDKLMKPSDIISTIRVNNDLFRSEYTCEQFQRELNFIDSFFESLQYLESCSLSEKCFKNEKIDALVQSPDLLETEIDAHSYEYDRFFSKLEKSAGADDSETMASKNLFLLNILIRDEQRRAKNLLFVLKRREDALKDFTKSQILYLENKKKQDNTDISALKKKQRGALLKLQHECGEMQRMRKALLTLSEKRKLTLMKTKKDLELKLNSNVDKIILGKKKLKRSASVDRSSPLKCFDLSSSGCEESSTSSQRNSVETLSSPEHVCLKIASSADKSIQTSESIPIDRSTKVVDQSTDTAADNFILVDGSYLNILFNNLSLPQIFSGGKHYEINEDALKNIVESANSRHQIDETKVVETLMDEIKNRDLDRSSSPSTARSLVEEFDHYYKVLNDCDRSPVEPDCRSYSTVHELSDAYVQVDPSLIENPLLQNTSTMTIDSNATIVNNETEIESTDLRVCESEIVDDCNDILIVSPTGPLPVPVGADAVVDSSVPDPPLWLPTKSSSNTTFTESSSVSSSLSRCEVVSSVTSHTAPAQCEAEELRRQQLAIEKEIKELEQQQCRLLVVREIPDKPPPPYTPPVETKTSNPRKFQTDDATRDKVRMYITGDAHEACDPTDSFDVFINDFCHEAVARATPDRSDLPWDACNLPPPKPELDPVKLVQTITVELDEVLTGVKPTVVSGVSSKRSDQIDDILFTEWRRVEPEWTALHNDEAIVKNQIFESIFQRILTDTVDEYKRTVLCEPAND